MPIILLVHETSKDRLPVYISAGADDIVTQPLYTLELETRVLSAIRLARKHFGTKLFWEGIELDTQTHSVTCDGQELKLSPRSFSILARLMRDAPNVVSRAEIENMLYDKKVPDSDSQRVFIHQIRAELARVGKPILKTVPKVGFKLIKMSEHNLEK